MSRSTKSAVPRTKPHDLTTLSLPSPSPPKAPVSVHSSSAAKGFGDEIVYAPECSSSESDSRFQDTNISVVNEAFRDEVPVGKVDTADAFEIISDGAWASQGV